MHEVDIQCLVVTLAKFLLGREIRSQQASDAVVEAPIMIECVGGLLKVELDVCWFCMGLANRGRFYE